MSKHNFAGRAFGALAFTTISAGTASAQTIFQNNVGESAYAVSFVAGQPAQNLSAMHIVADDRTPDPQRIAFDIVQLPAGREMDVTARSADANFASVRIEITDIGVPIVKTRAGLPKLHTTDFVAPPGWSITNVNPDQYGVAGPYPKPRISSFHVSMAPWGPR